ncbi:uncharacterized protein [Asterias amurensis]|uniref:uncharacterized protein n=1 Tax=Asterias amurensis TaxID=7602 RepID=UPI003AB47E9D
MPTHPRPARLQSDATSSKYINLGIRSGICVAGGNNKTAAQCKDRYRNLVQAITKRKWQIRATGGGPNPPPLSQPQLLIESTLSQVKLEGIDSPVDTFSDSFGNSSTADNPELPVQADQPKVSACEVVNLDPVYSMPITIADDVVSMPINLPVNVMNFGTSGQGLLMQDTSSNIRPPKRKCASGITEAEYLERKLALIEKEQGVRMRALLAQASCLRCLEMDVASRSLIACPSAVSVPAPL